MRSAMRLVAPILVGLMIFIATEREGAFAATPPPNDDFAGAIDVTLPTAVGGTTNGASLESGEPQCSSAMNRTVWYRMQPSRTGILQVLPTYGVTANVWSGTTLGSLSY